MPTVCPPIMPMPPADPLVSISPQVGLLIARTTRNTHAQLFILYLPARNPFSQFAVDSIQTDQLPLRHDGDGKTACHTTAILRCRKPMSRQTDVMMCSYGRTLTPCPSPTRINRPAPSGSEYDNTRKDSVCQGKTGKKGKIFCDGKLAMRRPRRKVTLPRSGEEPSLLCSIPTLGAARSHGRDFWSRVNSETRPLYWAWTQSQGQHGLQGPVLKNAEPMALTRGPNAQSSQSTLTLTSTE